jgi:hypothetical protein
MIFGLQIQMHFAFGRRHFEVEFHASEQKKFHVVHLLAELL